MSIAVVLATVATALAGHPVTVTCQPMTVRDGLTAGNAIVIRDTLCDAIDKVRHGYLTMKAGRAVLALAHESMHASDLPNSDNETLTECRAIRVAKRASRLLGLSPRMIAQLWPWIVYDHRAVRDMPGYADFVCPAKPLG